MTAETKVLGAVQYSVPRRKVATVERGRYWMYGDWMCWTLAVQVGFREVMIAGSPVTGSGCGQALRVA